MIKKILICLFGVLLLSRAFVIAQQPRNYTDIEDFFQDFTTTVNSIYWLRLHELTDKKKYNQIQIQQLLATWKASRCLLRSVALANTEDLSYNPDMHRYTLMATLPKGRAYWTFETDSRGFWRFTNYSTEGNPNFCPPATLKDGNSFYANVDLIGTWEYKETVWSRKPESLQKDLSENGYDEAKIQRTLRQRQTKLDDEVIANIQRITFKADGSCVVVTPDDTDYETRWAIGYNQFKLLTESGDYAVHDWRINKDGNLELIDDNREGRGAIARVYKRK